jgi:uncharacterized phage protein (TIGR02220 family)
MYRGYVKLWRKSIDTGWLSNHKMWVFWSWCLMKASHKEHKLIVGYKQVHLMPGDLVFGLDKASAELKISVRSIRTILDFLKKSENITIKTTNKFSVISITNWDTYQSEKSENDNQNDKQTTNKRQTNDNKQECKECKEEKEYISDVKKLPKEKDEAIPYKEIIEYLNKKANKHYDYKTESTRKLIKARWGKNGNSKTIEDFFTVIDNKCAAWLNEEFNGKPASNYLRPETLFGNKFESYLNEKLIAEPNKPWEKP